MFFKKNKLYICILVSFVLINLFIPIITYSFNNDSIYVWSNNSSSVSTSTDSTSITEETTPNKSSSR